MSMTSPKQLLSRSPEVKDAPRVTGNAPKMYRPAVDNLHILKVQGCQRPPSRLGDLAQSLASPRGSSDDSALGFRKLHKPFERHLLNSANFFGIYTDGLSRLQKPRSCKPSNALLALDCTKLSVIIPPCPNLVVWPSKEFRENGRGISCSSRTGW